MLDLSRVVSGSLLTESFTIQRSSGSFVLGGYATASTAVQGFGVVSVANAQDLQMLPEGDRVTGAMVFHSQAPLYETILDTSMASAVQRFSDVILWNGSQYRIVQVSPYPNRNYWRAVGVRMAGQ